MAAENKHLGSAFESFLEEEDIGEQVYLRAKKKIIADQMCAEMEANHVTVAALAPR